MTSVKENIKKIRKTRENGDPKLDQRTIVQFSNGSLMDSGVAVGKVGANCNCSMTLGTSVSIFQIKLHDMMTCAGVNLNRRMRGEKKLL